MSPVISWFRNLTNMPSIHKPQHSAMEVVMVKIQVSITTILVGTRQHLLPLLYM